MIMKWKLKMIKMNEKIQSKNQLVKVLIEKSKLINSIRHQLSVKCIIHLVNQNLNLCIEMTGQKMEDDYSEIFLIIYKSL